MGKLYLMAMVLGLIYILVGCTTNDTEYRRIGTASHETMTGLPEDQTYYWNIVNELKN